MARRFHELYERLAPNFGYETRLETRKFDPHSPNGRLMIAVCAELLPTEEQIADAASQGAHAVLGDTGNVVYVR